MQRSHTFVFHFCHICTANYVEQVLCLFFLFASIALIVFTVVVFSVECLLISNLKNHSNKPTTDSASMSSYDYDLSTFSTYSLSLLL